MTLKQWLENRWLTQYQTSKQEIATLLTVIDRDLQDAEVSALSLDWRMAIAYNAALQCALTALAAEGYRPGRGGSHHYYAVESLRFTLDPGEDTVITLDAYRRKRNISDYQRAGVASETEVQQLHELASSLRTRLLKWLRERHPHLTP